MLVLIGAWWKCVIDIVEEHACCVFRFAMLYVENISDIQTGLPQVGSSMFLKNSSNIAQVHIVQKLHDKH
jgi:hypothetical protein